MNDWAMNDLSGLEWGAGEWSNVVFGGIVMLLAAFMAFSQHRSWSLVQTRTRDNTELEFLKRRFEHRFKTSGVIGIIGILVTLGVFFRSPSAVLSYWAGVALLVLFLLFQAVKDWANSRDYYVIQHRKVIQARDRLADEIERRKAAQKNSANGNGKVNGKSTHEKDV